MKLAQIEKYLLILVLIVNLIVLYRVLTTREGFSTPEEDQEDNDRHYNWVTDTNKYVSYKPSMPFEAVCK